MNFLGDDVPILCLSSVHPSPKRIRELKRVSEGSQRASAQKIQNGRGTPLSQKPSKNLLKPLTQTRFNRKGAPSPPNHLKPLKNTHTDDPKLRRRPINPKTTYNLEKPPTKKTRNGKGTPKETMDLWKCYI